ncbi:hypothetical protein ACQP0C_37490 [Nocardia sp. CA-129566]|uniref:hypothetical protein n=1 Tax=Nocardia sp. CA-129566 TaxID=3239976 RepID=UPI003D958B18
MRDKQSTDGSEIAALAERVANARGRLPLQDDAALVQVLSDAEIDAERELAQWVRAQRREQRKRAVEDELAAETRNRRTTAAIQRADDADARWHRRALAARRRVSNQDARLAQLYRRAEWSSRALIAVVVLGMVWAGVNVQHNLVPSGNMADPLYWLSYGIEAMISIPIITIMVAATTAARWGRELDRGKVVFFETALLGTTVALNAGPHLAAGSFGQAAEYAIAPVMVGVVIWLHAWVSARYALLIDGVPLVDDEPEVPPRHRVTTERGAPITTFRADEPTDRRELLAAKGFDPLLDQAGVRFPVDMTDPHASHVAEAAMRGAQPEAVPVSRLDCTETLVYHAQSTRSTNGRVTQQIPAVDEYRHAGGSASIPSTDSLHAGARTFTNPAAQPISNHAEPNYAETSAAATTGHTETATRTTPNAQIGPDATSADDISAPSATFYGASQPPSIDQPPTPASSAGDARVHDAAAIRATLDESATTDGISPHSAPHTPTAAAGQNPQPTYNPAAAPSALGEHMIHADLDPRLVSDPATSPAEDRAAANFQPHTSPAPSDQHTTAATAQPATAPATAANTSDQHTTPAAAGAEPRTAPVTTHTEHTAPMSTRDERTPGSGVASQTAQTNTANPRDEHTTPLATASTTRDEHTAAGFGITPQATQATTASPRNEHAASAATAASTRDEHTTPTSGINPRSAQADTARAPEQHPTASAAAADSHRASTFRTAADSQLSIFDTATVEPMTRTGRDAAENRAPAATTRVQYSNTGTESPTRTEARRSTHSSAAPTPAERIGRVVEPQPDRSSTGDARVADHEHSQHRTEEPEAEVRQLDQRRTTSEVISEVVQSLSADELLAENLGSESDDIEVWSVARAIAGRGLSVIPVEQLAEILMLADQSWTPTSIGAEVGLSRTAIAQVLEFARRVRRPYAISS